MSGYLRHGQCGAGSHLADGSDCFNRELAATRVKRVAFRDGQVLPNGSANDLLDDADRDVESCCQFSVESLGFCVQLANLKNIIIGQFVRIMRRTSLPTRQNSLGMFLTLRLPVFAVSISRIIPLSARKQMCRIYARGVVAVMANAWLGLRHWTVSVNPSEPVRGNLPSINTGLTVSTFRQASLPNPARSQFGSVLGDWSVTINFAPEFLRRHFWSSHNFLSTKERQPLQMENRLGTGRIQSNWRKFVSTLFPSPSCLFSQTVTTA